MTTAINQLHWNTDSSLNATDKIASSKAADVQFDQEKYPTDPTLVDSKDASPVSPGIYAAELLRPMTVTITGKINTDSHWLSSDFDLVIPGIQVGLNNARVLLTSSDLAINNLSGYWFDERLSMEFSTLELNQWRAKGLENIIVNEMASQSPIATLAFDRLDMKEFNLSLNPLQPLWNWQLQHIIDHTQVDQLTIKQTNNHQILIDRLRFKQLNTETSDGEPIIDLQQFALSAGQYLPDNSQSAVAALGHYQIDDIRLDRRQLVTGVHQLSGLRANIERSAQGDIQWFVAAASDPSRVMDSSQQAHLAEMTTLAVNSVIFQDIYGEDGIVSPPQIEPLEILADDIVYSDNGADNKVVSKAVTPKPVTTNAVTPKASSVAVKSNLSSNNPLSIYAQQVAQMIEQLPFTINLAGIRLQSTSDVIDRQNDADISSRIIIVDKGVIPAKTFTVQLNQGQISAFDSEQYQRPLQLYLQSQLDEFNRNHLLINSRFKFDDIEIDGAINLEQLNLIPFNSYIQAASGYRLKQGLMNDSSQIQIRQGQIIGNNQVILEDIKLVAANDQAIRGFEQHLALPLDMTLGLMADKKRQVKLSFPVTGSLMDPNVSLLNIVQKATATALKKGSLVYLRQALQPYGSLVSVANVVGKELFAIRLDQLLFVDNSAELTAISRQQLQKVEQLMQKKINLRLVVCPNVSDQEQQLIGDNWMMLADQRGLAVKRFFVNRKDRKGQLLTDRITICEASLAEQPRVVLGLE